jgi:hypothetical protein
MRTTLDIETPILREIRRIMQREARSMGGVVSELLAEALARRPRRPTAAARLEWIARPMRARVDLADKDAVHAALDATRDAP